MPIHTQGARHATEKESRHFIQERICLTQLAKKSTESEIRYTTDQIKSILSKDDSAKIHEVINSVAREVW